MSLSLLIASVLVLMIALPASAASMFNDTGSCPYKASIDSLASRGIVGGYDDGSFRPDNLLMRQQYAKMAVLTMAYDVTIADVSSFTDTPAASPSNPLYPGSYVAVAAKNHVIAGYPDNTFRFDDKVTRQQTITIIVRAAGSALTEPPADYHGVLDYSDPTHGQNVKKAEYNGLLDGIAGLASWDTSENATRGEAAQLLSQLLSKTTQTLTFDNTKHETLTAQANTPIDITFDPSVMGCSANIHFVTLDSPLVVKTSAMGENVTYHTDGLPAGTYQWKCSMEDCCYGTLVVEEPGTTHTTLTFDNTKHETLTAQANTPIDITFDPSVMGCSANIHFVTLDSPLVVKTSAMGENVTYHTDGLPAGTYQWKCSMEDCCYGTLVVE